MICRRLTKLTLPDNNLPEILRKIEPETVDLIYLDPPFYCIQSKGVVNYLCDNKHFDQKGGREANNALIFKKK